MLRTATSLLLSLQRERREVNWSTALRAMGRLCGGIQAWRALFFFFLFFGLRTSWCFSWDIGGGNITRRQRQRVCKKEPRGTQYRLVYEKEGGRAKGKAKERETVCQQEKRCLFHIHTSYRPRTGLLFFLGSAEDLGSASHMCSEKGVEGARPEIHKIKKKHKEYQKSPHLPRTFPFPLYNKKTQGPFKAIKTRERDKKKKKKKRKEKKKRARFAMHMRRPKTRETLSMNPIRHVFVKSYPKSEEEAPPL